MLTRTKIYYNPKKVNRNDYSLEIASYSTLQIVASGNRANVWGSKIVRACALFLVDLRANSLIITQTKI